MSAQVTPGFQRLLCSTFLHPGRRRKAHQVYLSIAVIERDQQRQKQHEKGRSRDADRGVDSGPQ